MTSTADRQPPATVDEMDESTFFVVVPYYNEAAGMRPTLEALASQTDTAFSLVLVNNGSTDESETVARAFAEERGEFPIFLINEPQKGTGAASDTGFRFAIDHGAKWIARTDADCLPRRDWVANTKRAFREQGLDLIAGKIKARTDEAKLTWRDRLLLPLMVVMAENFGKLHRRGKQFHYPYIMVAGNNMAITADMYRRAGGFPRTSIEEMHEDRALSEQVRKLTKRGKVRRDVVVFNSIRRARRYGYLNTLLWYWDHKYRPQDVDVRWRERDIPASPQRNQLRMRFHEFLVYAASHPLALLLAETTRRLGPVVQVPVIGSIVNDPSIARTILQDPRFTKSGPGSFGAVIDQVMQGNVLLNSDGLPHRELRDRLTDLFSPSYLDAQLEPLLRAECERLPEALAKGEPVDLVAFMHRLTGRLTCQMMGIPAASANESELFEQIFAAGSRLLSLAKLSTRQLTPSQLQTARRHYDELTAFARPAYDDPDRDVGSLIARLRSMGLSWDEARGIVAVFFLVGMETVSTALPRIVALLVDSGSFGLLHQRPVLLTSAIDEGLRFVVPSPIMVRNVFKASEVRGHRFSRNCRILLLTYNLAKDGHYVPRPRQFDITRSIDPVVRNIWFGAGPHFCLGHALAHREIKAVLLALLCAPGILRIVERRYARGVMLPSYSRLVVQTH